VRRVADLMRVRAGLGGKINVENDIGPTAAHRRPLGGSDFSDVSAWQNSQRGARQRGAEQIRGVFEQRGLVVTVECPT
jgi:hypothetical protein